MGSSLPIFKDYYKMHLPIDVTTWVRVNEPDENLRYKDGQGKQIVFIRDTIMRNMFYDGEDDYNLYNTFQPMVISTHRSKSVLLPVMEMNLDKLGIRITLRNNFYDWNLSIESINDIECDFKGLLNDNTYNYCFCEGFPNDRIFGQYKDNHKQFTICINNDYDLYAFMYIFRDYLKK